MGRRSLWIHRGVLNSCFSVPLGLYEREEIPDYITMLLLTVEIFLLKGLQLVQLVFSGFGDGIQQSFMREILFRKYLLVVFKAILN